MATFQWVFQFRCPQCGESILLPRRSPLGIYEGQQYLTTPMWPITLLCRLRVPVYECLADGIDLDPVYRPDPSLPKICLWEIEAECAHEGCRLRHCIYAKYQPDKTTQDVIGSVLKANPKIPCSGDHDLVFSSEKMKVTDLAF